MISRLEYRKGSILKHACILDMLKVFQGSSNRILTATTKTLGPLGCSESFGWKCPIIVISTTANWHDVLNFNFNVWEIRWKRQPPDFSRQYCTSWYPKVSALLLETCVLRDEGWRFPNLPTLPVHAGPDRGSQRSSAHKHFGTLTGIFGLRFVGTFEGQALLNSIGDAISFAPVEGAALASESDDCRGVGCANCEGGFGRFGGHGVYQQS